MPHLTSRFDDALTFAARVHATQTRKGAAVPYIAHLLQVAGIALEHGADEDIAIAALLHDAAEDQGGETMLARIEARFGPHVANVVRACSDTLETPKPPWRERKQRYLAHLREASDGARLVSAADKLHNARSIVDDLRDDGAAAFSKFNGGREGTLWYYAAVADALQGRVAERLHAELERTVRTMHALAE